jgi:oligopeptide/dipeptide ABC transporter ATP-binding protein
VADRVGVMYASRIAEIADVKELFARPLHPYTRSLFRSLPRLGDKKERLETIPGSVPNPLEFPAGCTFHTRCFLTKELAKKAGTDATIEIESVTEKFRVLKRCADSMPPLKEIAKGHWCSCWECEGFAEGINTDPSIE